MGYVEDLSDARTWLAGFFSILLRLDRHFGRNASLLEMIGGLSLDEREQAFIFLCRAEKLERDPTWTDGAHHGGDFQWMILLACGNFQIKDIVDVHLSLALDDAAAHRQVQDRAFSAYFSPREREKKPDGNSEVFATIHRVTRIV